MSSSTTTNDRDSTSGDGSVDSEEADARALERAVPMLAKPIRVTSFWLAIVLPFLYVPLLVTGLSSWSWSVAFFGLLSVNLLALYVGHAHRE